MIQYDTCDQVVHVQADVPPPPVDEENQFQQIIAARKYIAEQALKQQTKKVCIASYYARQPPQALS